MAEYFITTKKPVQVKYLRAKCGVRYWEDATVNGVEDMNGDLIPFRNGKYWEPVIDLDTGKIEAWPEGITASVNYKVCDDGAYELINEEKAVVSRIEGYAPDMMCPGGVGYRDYVEMDIGPDGTIANWKVDFSEFAQGDADA